MSASEENSDDKEHEPSAKRLDDARKKGDVARSADLMAASSYLGLYVAASLGAPVIIGAATAGKSFLDHAPEIATTSGTALAPYLGGFLVATVGPCLLLMLLPGAASLLTVLAQRGLVFAPSKLAPKLSRISPMANAKQKFGPEGLFEFAKNTIKLLLIATALGLFIGQNLQDIISLAALEAGPGTVFLLRLLGEFLMISALLTGAIGAIDFLWQRHALLRRNRMSRQEMLDEMKDSDGDPQAKATRKQRGQEIAMNQMLAEVPSASVIIVNPTHYAVALRWRRGDSSAPLVVAKGTDELAMKIRDAATKANVPIHSDPPTARAIYATTKVRHPISREHYKAVAAAIRFAEKMKSRGNRPA